MTGWKRAKRDEIITAHRRTWESRCNVFRVQELESKFGEPTRYYALAGNHLISIHRTRNAAEKACEEYVAKVEQNVRKVKR